MLGRLVGSWGGGSTFRRSSAAGSAVDPPVPEILRAYWKADRPLLLFVGAIVALSSLAAVSAPYLFSRLVDRISQEDGATSLAVGFGLYAVLMGVAAALQHMVQYLSFVTAENLGFIASTRFFERLLRKTPAFFIEHNSVQIQGAGDKARGALTVLVQLVLIAFVPGMAQILLSVALLGSVVNHEVAGIVLAYGSASVAITLLANRRTRAYLDAAVEAGQVNARFVGNAISAMETLRHFGSHGWMSKRFGSKAREVRDNWRAYALHRVGYVTALGLGLTLQFAITFWLLIPRYQAGALSVGDIVLFNTLVLQLNMPFEMIAHAIDDVARSRAALAPFAAMWAAPEEQPSPETPMFDPRAGSIAFEDVSYAYDNGRGVCGATFTAARGGITFIVGETGSGKSTLLRLALKSMEPDTGRIVVDGVDLRNIARSDWYRVVAVVPQEVVLLNESLADNILLGRTRDEQRLRRAAAKAAILPLVESLPDAFETHVGERGLRLSGGERQRIAIARALYGEPAILFLDEASSALDEETERDILAHVRELSEEVTVLAITHRSTVITDTDRVIRLAGR